MLSTLRALWQADGAFPSGSFAFSYGIEGIIALRHGLDARELKRLVTAALTHRWAS
jgi:urease accessory protein